MDGEQLNAYSWDNRLLGRLQAAILRASHGFEGLQRASAAAYLQRSLEQRSRRPQRASRSPPASKMQIVQVVPRKCRSIKWPSIVSTNFNQVATSKFVPDENVQYFGWVRNEASGFCLDMLQASDLQPASPTWRLQRDENRPQLLGVFACQSGGSTAQVCERATRLAFTVLPRFSVLLACAQRPPSTRIDVRNAQRRRRRQDGELRVCERRDRRHVDVR